MVRFYDVDPERLINLPAYVLSPLVSQLATLEARERLWVMEAALLPWMKEDARRSAIRDVIRQVRVPHERMEVIEENPQKAAQWFREQGYRVEDGNV